ncbi:thyroid adenoma-associated-like protein [Wolffia australiana]
MSAKWRALQHRHRYTYNSVVFPSSFFSSLSSLEQDSASEAPLSLSSFLSALRDLALLDTTFAQVAAAKTLAKTLPSLFSSSPSKELSSALQLYLSVLFVENSLPLHRPIISGLARAGKALPFFEECIVSLCRDQIKQFSVSRALLSLLSYPKLGFLDGVLESCAVVAAIHVSESLVMVGEGISHGSRPSPVVMEQCQDAMSCLYYLLQRFPSKFRCEDGEDDESMRAVLRAVTLVLKSVSFSRDCLVAAGVSFWAALQTRLESRQIANFIAWGLFGIREGSEIHFESLLREISEFSVLGRICLIRGLLSAIPLNLLLTEFCESEGSVPWRILNNGILPELCNYCRNPVDSHFNFHVLTVTQICLQQIKKSVSVELRCCSKDYDPLPGDAAVRLMRIIWNNLEDPLNQTVKQVHLIFDLLLDVKEIIHGQEKKCFQKNMAGELLRLGPRCKGRYAPLASLTKRLGAKTLLELNPLLLFDTINAYEDDDVCCAATSFLKCFLESLRDECWIRHGVEEGYSVYRGLSLPPIMQGLLGGLSKLRSNLTTYALPIVLEIDVDSIFPMLDLISFGPNQKDERDERKIGDVLRTPQFVSGINGYDKISGQRDEKLEETQFMGDFGSLDKTEKGEKHKDLAGKCVAGLVSVLKVARQLSLVSGDVDWDQGSTCNAILLVNNVLVKVPVTSFMHALTHADENVRVDAAEFLFLNPKTASIPSALELKMMRDVVPLNMRSSSTGFQMRWISSFKKFFHRARTALERHAKQGFRTPDNADQEKVIEIQRSLDLLSFMKWLSGFLFSSCYCSAPYERKIMAMGLILTMLDVWPLLPASQGVDILPYGEGFPTSDLTLSLVGSIVDSWDRIRESSFQILLHFRSPLSGMTTSESVFEVITWAKELVCSPRVRESDAGALTLRFIFRKYVLELGWTVWVSENVVCHGAGDSSKHDMIKNETFSHYISSLIDWLRAIVEVGERDLAEASKICFVHGVLLALRYTFEELDWSLISKSPKSYSEMKSALGELLDLIVRVTSVALWVVSADSWYLPDEIDNMVTDDSFISDMVDMRGLDPSLESECGSKHLENDHVADQAVMVACWLSMKEVSLLLGTVIRKIPLPCSDGPDSEHASYPISYDVMLDAEQLEDIGGHFLQVLLKMKHNGAIDKTRAGFTALCNRLLCSNVPRLCQMTEAWMNQLMERVMAKDQTVDDLLRRSAGIPAAFMALFLSEPEGAPKKLLPRALRWLIDVASKPPEGSNLCNGSLTIDGQSKVSLKVPKARDEGVIPTVHAFNILRAAFNDANLAVDTSGFCAEALIISIRSFSSPYWEVRNSACLTFSALIRRMIGFLNVQKRESVKRALTGLEFFHRYPTLHLFLFEELKVATRFSVNGILEKQSVSNVSSAIHPSLCPILILLSRLKPSIVGNEDEDPLDPFLFMPFIRKCATQSNYRVRVLASRALTGLVSNEKLPGVINGITQCLLPEDNNNAGSMKAFSSVSLNSIHGMLLQLSSLIDSNCRNFKDDSLMEMVLSGLIHNISKCSWIGSFRLCPCPTLVSSYLKVLRNILDVVTVCKRSSNTTTQKIKTLYLRLSSECLEDRDRSGGLAFFDPTVEEARQQAVGSFLQCFFSENSESAELAGNLEGLFLGGFEEKIQACVSDPSSDVRITTLKLLLKFISSAGEHGWLRVGLQPMLMDLLKTEENSKCIYYIMSCIYSWNLLHFVCSSTSKDDDVMHVGLMCADGVISFWERLLSLVSSNGSLKTRAMIIRCMGLCIRRLIGHLSDQTHISICGCVDKFLQLVKKNSSPAEPVNLRKAAADAIIASGLLQDSILAVGSVLREPTFHSWILEAWFICIQLLEDEDVGLRKKLAEDVQGCISSYLSRRGLFNISAPFQVERVMELTFDFLSSVFSDVVLYMDRLLSCVFRMTDNGPSQMGNLVRVVFDKEIDNHHEEKLLICQICCFHCEKLIKSHSWAAPERLEFLGMWRTKFINRLVSFSEEFLEKGDKEGWVGGLGNHKDTFLGVYGPLLGIYALTQSPLVPAIIEKQTEEIDKAVSPFLTNPLTWRLYSLLSAAAQKSQSFDPYFLLG